MRVISIPKKSSGFRTIYIPSKEESVTYKSSVSTLSKRAALLDTNNVMHGFVRGKSPVTAALMHVNYAWTVCFDLENFFDNVTETKFSGLLSKELVNLVLVDGAARQGLPTSPSAANIAASKMDKAILRFFSKKKMKIVYTRYADDLTFSGNDTDHMTVVVNVIPKIISKCGWRIKKEKTHIQLASSGRRHICGVSVDDYGIHPTRRVKRKLRAALHQNNTSHANGLTEWMKLKKPTVKIVRDDNEIKALAKCWRLRVRKKLPQKEDLIDNDFIITGDPVYMLGCSTWTTGWRSCLAHPGGTHRRGTPLLCSAPIRIAALLSNKTKEIAGVTRRVMRARCFVYEMSDGKMAYDKLYGEDGSKQELESKLKEMGYIYVRNLKGSKVNKNFSYSGSKPFFDNLRLKKITLKTGEKTNALYVK